MRWPGIARRRSPLGATSTKPSRSSSTDCSARSRGCSAQARRPGAPPMPDRSGEPPVGATARRTFFVLGSIGLVVAALYLGQRIFVPLALAVLLTLVLGPVVIWLERRGLGRLPAVLSAALLAFLLIGLGGWAVAAQVTDLLADLPAHKMKVKERLARSNGGGSSGPLRTVKDLVSEVEKAGSADEP